MRAETEKDRFARVLLPHLDAAYGLAYWLMRNEADAQDAVQEAYLRAYRYFGSFRGGDGRSWLLKIVRNACNELRDRERHTAHAGGLDEDEISPEMVATGAIIAFPRNPETAAMERADSRLVQQSLRALPQEFREVMILRELHGCGYREIASIVGVPIGTVMSRLARGRRRLLAVISENVKREDTGT